MYHGLHVACNGFSSIEWGIAGKIFISWTASPLVAGSVAAVFFFCVKTFVMHAKDPFERTFYTFPIVLTIGIG
jgi:phosphate/sulfate permease